MAFDPTINYAEEIEKAKSKGLSTTALEQARAEKIAAASDATLATYKVNRAGQNVNSVEAQAPNGPPKLTNTEIAILKQQPNVKNDITIKDSNGSINQITGYVLNGHSYDENGQRLFSYGPEDSGGKYAYSDITVKEWERTNRENYAATSYIELKQKESAQSLSYEPIPTPNPLPIIPPPFISWNEPSPVFNSDLKEVNKYSYFFGLDQLAIKHCETNQNCCFISQEILLGSIVEDCYIQLESECVTSDYSSIEFSILDGGSEYPILPIGNKLITNEKIFFGLDTRFAVDNSKEIIIKKNGFIVDVSLEKAKQSNDGLYTITYHTTDDQSYKPMNSSIKLKAILRLYNKGTNSPYVNKMKIRKFGGGTLWKDISII